MRETECTLLMADSAITNGPKSSACRTWVLLAVVWIVALSGVLRAVMANQGSELPGAICTTVNPNVAPWWELTALPDIGPALARRIVDYRESRSTGESTQPFRSPGDLDAVSGIGPKTVRRIAPFLRFDIRPSSSEAVSR